MPVVNAHNEWDPLEEVIVGVVDNARVPSPDRGLFAVDYADRLTSMDQIPSGPYSERVVRESAADLERFAEVLRSYGVVVRRPRVADHSRPFASPEWSVDGEYNYCPRDVILPIGDTLIETPMALRTRYFEPFSYKDILLEYFEGGANWVSAPKPRLADETYETGPGAGQVLANLEPVFDAANVLRIGKDVLYQVSCSGNRLGARWLQRVLGDAYTVHVVEGVYDGSHLDTTIMPLRPGLVLLNPERVGSDRVPAVFKNWDVIWCPPLPGVVATAEPVRASSWIGMNLLMINPELAVVDAAAQPLIKELNRHGIETEALPIRHSRVLSGGFHCVSLDIRRTGLLEDYS
ncbi:inosamine-phosphate amidinotransferase 1 [Streptomyces xiamenensis]|uniref:inosamine-phosphate amidinotransferase 1 n=1 Tax=Streptomyces xiamenensis TaxID=408015 RepID=UPI0036F1299E